MKKNLAAIACLLATGLQTACTDLAITPKDGFVLVPIIDGGTCASPHDLPDLAMAGGTCAAAKGLSGVPLICTNFPSAQTLTDLTAAGWNFTTAMSGTCTGWTVANNQLQINNFAALTGSCGILMKPISPTDYQKYSSFTLSVVQTVDINATKQGAYIYLGLDVSPQQIWYTTGTYAKTVTALQIAKTDLPNGGNGTYQPFFKITSTLAGGATGWQIESIAVMGNP